jgi:GGDEF domain-containing protein
LKFIDPQDYQDMLQSMIIARTSTEDFRKECRIVSKNQDSKWTEVVISPILNDSICIGSVFICTDITERKKHHDIIIEAIHKDELTGLYNRRYLDQRMEEMLTASQSGATHFSILLLDIDFFKKVNDSFRTSSW